jgi:hypothetical protein
MSGSLSMYAVPANREPILLHQGQVNSLGISGGVMKSGTRNQRRIGIQDTSLTSTSFDQLAAVN